MSEARKYLEVVERLREIGLMDDPALLAETTHLFLHDAADQIEAMRQALAKGDNDALLRASHRLKGAALNLGVAGVAEPARRIEENARRGERRNAASALAAIESELQCVAEFLRGLAKAGVPL